MADHAVSLAYNGRARFLLLADSADLGKAALGISELTGRFLVVLLARNPENPAHPLFCALLQEGADARIRST